MPRKALILAAAFAALWLTAAAASDRTAALDGVDYIRTTQADDGGFGGFGIGQSFDAILAIRSAGIDPNTVTTAGNSPADFLRASASEAAEAPGLAAKGALAALSLDLDPADVDGVDLVAAIESAYDAESGAYAGDALNNGLAVLGVVCTGGTVPGEATGHIRDIQLEDGGWGFDDSGDIDTTAIVVQALIAAGVDLEDAALADGLAFIDSAEFDGGGWGFDEPNANSTAYVIQSLLAAGRNADGSIALLASMQEDDGSFPGFDPAFATNQAVPALAGRSFCDAPVTELQEVPDPTETPTEEPTEQPASPTTTVDATSTPGAPETGSATAGGGMSASAFALVAVVLVVGGVVSVAAARRN